MEFKCIELDQAVVDDILSLGPALTPRYLERQYSRFIDSSPSILDNLYRHFELGNRDAFFSDLHKLSGFAATLGSKQVQKHCQWMGPALDSGVKDELETLTRLLASATSEMVLLLQESRKFYRES